MFMFKVGIFQWCTFALQVMWTSANHLNKAKTKWQGFQGYLIIDVPLAILSFTPPLPGCILPDPLNTLLTPALSGGGELRKKQIKCFQRCPFNIQITNIRVLDTLSKRQGWDSFSMVFVIAESTTQMLAFHSDFNFELPWIQMDRDINTHFVSNSIRLVSTGVSVSGTAVEQGKFNQQINK